MGDWADRALAEATEGCCANAEWRGHLCQYHQGYEDGLDRARMLKVERYEALVRDMDSRDYCPVCGWWRRSAGTHANGCSLVPLLALTEGDEQRCPAGICTRPAGHRGPHRDGPAVALTEGDE